MVFDSLVMLIELVALLVDPAEATAVVSTRRLVHLLPRFRLLDSIPFSGKAVER